MAESNKPLIYQQLVTFQSKEGCDQHELRAELHRYALLFIQLFQLGIDEFVIGIDNLRRNRLGQFRYGINPLGLRAEILLDRDHVFESMRNDEVWRIFGTILHELLHGWQEKFGRPGRRNYHNKEFRRRAAELGLIVDERGVTEYDPGSPFFDILEKEGITVPKLTQPKLFQKRQATKSKLTLWSCLCDPPQRARIGKSEFFALCPICNNYFRPE